MNLTWLFSFFKKTDWFLIMIIAFLAVFGLAAIYSVALGRGAGEFLNFHKQLIWLIVSFIVIFIIANINYRLWQKIGWLGYLLSLLMLILVLTPLGSTIHGSRGWFDFGWFSFQPVEMMKIFLIIILADILSRYGRTIHKLSQLIIIGLLAFAPLGLVMLQPDFGSAMILFFLWLASFLLIVKKKWQVLLILLTIISVVIFAWFFVFKDYQKDRIKNFINPALDPQGSGYNVKQSIIAVGAGRLMGKGLGFGSQSQLKFIPESQTDFIFSVIAEELGFVGVVFILTFFALLFYRLYKIAGAASDDFGLFLTLLIAVLIFFHVLINIGMCLGLLPVTGISLPFISYGGSFLLTIMILIGLTLNIYKNGVFSRRHNII